MADKKKKKSKGFMDKLKSGYSKLAKSGALGAKAEAAAKKKK